MSKVYKKIVLFAFLFASCNMLFAQPEVEKPKDFRLAYTFSFPANTEDNNLSVAIPLDVVYPDGLGRANLQVAMQGVVLGGVTGTENIDGKEKPVIFEKSEPQGGAINFWNINEPNVYGWFTSKDKSLVVIVEREVSGNLFLFKVYKEKGQPKIIEVGATESQKNQPKASVKSTKPAAKKVKAPVKK